MTIKIIKYPNPILERYLPDMDCKHISTEARNIIFDAHEFAITHGLETMNGAVIGSDLRFTWIKNEFAEAYALGVIYDLYLNPVIIDALDESVRNSPEKSVSISTVDVIEVPRYFNIRVRYEDLLGEKFEEDFTDNKSYLMQSQIDALNGITLIDRAVISRTLKTYQQGYLNSWEDNLKKPVTHTFPKTLTVTEETSKDDTGN